MKTELLKPNRSAFEIASKLINAGENVAFPTETVYGLGADATNEDAVKLIFERKGRPQDNPLIVHLSNKEDIEKYAFISNYIEKKLIDLCMPGPISLVLTKKPIICNAVTCGLNTVAIRIPENKIARDFITFCSKPICAPSANTSKKPSPTDAQTVYEDMSGKIPLILDGGNCKIGVESTVVKVENNNIYILRPGKYSAEKLNMLTGAVVVKKLIPSAGVAISPGTKYAHYMPSCETIMVKNNVVENLKKLYDNFVKANKKPIIFCSTKVDSFLNDLEHIVLGKNSQEFCKNLFRAFRKYEKTNDVIVCEYTSLGNMADALYDRLSKSASGNIV